MLWKEIKEHSRLTKGIPPLILSINKTSHNGKTHLSIGLGLEAIDQGRRVAFVSIGELVPLMKNEEYIRKAQLQMKRIREADLVIIDDMIYMGMDHHEANLFFHFINHLYERSSVIFTSNKGPKE